MVTIVLRLLDNDEKNQFKSLSTAKDFSIVKGEHSQYYVNMPEEEMEKTTELFTHTLVDTILNNIKDDEIYFTIFCNRINLSTTTFGCSKLLMEAVLCYIKTVKYESEKHENINAAIALDDIETAFTRILSKQQQMNNVSIVNTPENIRVKRDQSDDMLELKRLGLIDDSDDYGDIDFEDYDDDLDGFSFAEPKQKKNKDYYGKSRVWKDSDHIHRSIDRHGVVISSKSNLKKDERIIKEFLKEFIPGSQGWKKEFRAELAKRWINVYSISKKKLKSLEKEYRNNKNKKVKRTNMSNAFGLAQKVLKTRDEWFNPNK